MAKEKDQNKSKLETNLENAQKSLDKINFKELTENYNSMFKLNHNALIAALEYLNSLTQNGSESDKEKNEQLDSVQEKSEKSYQLVTSIKTNLENGITSMDEAIKDIESGIASLKDKKHSRSRTALVKFNNILEAIQSDLSLLNSMDWSEGKNFYTILKKTDKKIVSAFFFLKPAMLTIRENDTAGGENKKILAEMSAGLKTKYETLNETLLNTAKKFSQLNINSVSPSDDSKEKAIDSVKKEITSVHNTLAKKLENAEPSKEDLAPILKNSAGDLHKITTKVVEISSNKKNGPLKMGFSKSTDVALLLIELEKLLKKLSASLTPENFEKCKSLQKKLYDSIAKLPTKAELFPLKRPLLDFASESFLPLNEATQKSLSRTEKSDNAEEKEEAEKPDNAEEKEEAEKPDNADEHNDAGKSDESDNQPETSDSILKTDQDKLANALEDIGKSAKALASHLLGTAIFSNSEEANQWPQKLAAYLLDAKCLRDRRLRVRIEFSETHAKDLSPLQTAEYINDSLKNYWTKFSSGSSDNKNSWVLTLNHCFEVHYFPLEAAVEGDKTPDNYIYKALERISQEVQQLVAPDGLDILIKDSTDQERKSALQIFQYINSHIMGALTDAVYLFTKSKSPKDVGNDGGAPLPEIMKDHPPKNLKWKIRKFKSKKGNFKNIHLKIEKYFKDWKLKAKEPIELKVWGIYEEKLLKPFNKCVEYAYKYSLEDRLLIIIRDNVHELIEDLSSNKIFKYDSLLKDPKIIDDISKNKLVLDKLTKMQNHYLKIIGKYLVPTLKKIEETAKQKIKHNKKAK